MSIHVGGRGPGHLARTQGGRFPTDGSATLVLDFVGSDPGEYLSLNFLTTDYYAFEPDPAFPDSVVLFQIWR